MSAYFRTEEHSNNLFFTYLLIGVYSNILSAMWIFLAGFIPVLNALFTVKLFAVFE
jgi:hypothetical protein